jgi:trimeric autotransporter adhesin
VATASVVALLLAGVGIWAFFTGTGSGSASASTGSLPAPVLASPTVGAGTVALSWSPGVTPPAGGTVSYYVTRNGGNAAGNCPTSGSPTTQTGCTDSGLAAGNYTYTVVAVWRSWTSTSNSRTANVASGAATKLVFTQQPVGGVAEGLNFQTQAKVSVEDSANNVVTSDNGSVTLAVNSYVAGNGGSMQGTLGCTNNTVAAVNGVASFSGCQINGTAAAGTYTLSASRSGLTQDASGNVSIIAGSASKLVFTTQAGGGVTEGANFSPQPVVKVEDSFSNVVTGDSGSVTLAVNSYVAGNGGSMQARSPARLTR